MQKIFCEKCATELILICNGKYAVCFNEDFIYDTTTQSGEMVMKDGILVDDFIASEQEVVN